MSYYVTSLIRLLLVACVLTFQISGTKELASRATNIAWRTRSDTFVLFPLLELTLAVAQHHAGFIFEITLVCEIYCPPVLGGHCETVAMHCICETWLHSLCNLQVNLRYAHWHKFCDDGSFSSPKECRKAHNEVAGG